jgi:hypothetical protein
MGCRSLLTAAALVATLGVTAPPIHAQQAPSDRVLAQSDSGFNPTAVQALITSGDAAASRGDLATAQAKYEKAREASRLLLNFYRSLGGAFRGLDARIPREMDTKGREALNLQAEANLRLAALFRRQNQPTKAVPVLVEVVMLVTPSKPQGQKAYQSLVELGFVETEFKGASRPGS